MDENVLSMQLGWAVILCTVPAALSRAVGGKGVIVCSGARSVWEMRAPHDVMNLSTLFGLKQQQAKVGTLGCFACTPCRG